MIIRPIDEVVALAKQLGRDPTLVELKKFISPPLLKALIREYKSFSLVLEAIKNPPPPIDNIVQEQRMTRRYRAICSKKEQIQGFFRHVLDLDDLFDRAGNPESLKLIAQPDSHRKYVDIPAMNAFIKFLIWYEPNIHLILGDFVDCEGVAHWAPSSLTPRRLVPEMKLARGLLSKIREATPTVSTRIFCKGNHEDWIDQALLRMPELFEDLQDLGLEISLKTLLALDKFEYTLFPLNHLVQIGKAHFTHGIFTQQHHAKKHLDTFKCNIYYGHLHDDQRHNQSSVDGPLEAMSLGCLARLDAAFLKGRPNNWVHTFGIFEFFRDGTYTRFNPNILNGRFSFCGEIFDGNDILFDGGIRE